MGGETGPDLTRAASVAADVRGDTLGPIVRNGRVDKGMPAFSLGDADLAAVVAFIHDQKTKAESLTGGRRARGPRGSPDRQRRGGKEVFRRRVLEVPFAERRLRRPCEAAGGARAAAADALPHAAQRRGVSRAKVTVTRPSGEVVTGSLAYRDEFTIALTDSSGAYRAFPAHQVKFTRRRSAAGSRRAARESTPMTTCTTSWRTCTRFAERAGHGLRGCVVVAVACALCSRRRDSIRRRCSSRRRDSWPTYHGDYSGQRHSRLTQITPDNVGQLTLAWSFQTGQTQQIKASPILVERRDLHHDARQHLGDRRALGAAAVALHLSGQPGLSHRPSRRGRLQELRVPDDARRAPRRARRATPAR